MLIKEWIKQSLWLMVWLLGTLGAAGASIPEPNTILYGTASIGNVPLTRTSTWVTVSVEINSEVIDSYVMGADESAADYYVLRIPMDAVGERTPGTARAGDVATLFIDGTPAYTFTIAERGTITNLDINVSQSQNVVTCTSTQSGSLFDIATFGGDVACGNPNSLFVIGDGHTVTWDGTEGSLQGTVTVHTGGVFQVTGAGVSIPGSIILNGGKLDVQSNINLTKLEQTLSSTVEVMTGVVLSVTDAFTIGATDTLTLQGAGTFRVEGSFTLNGGLDVAEGIVDVQNTTLVLGSSLDMSGATLLTNSATNLTVTNDVTLTTDQAVTIQTLTLNNHRLTLGSASTDLVVHTAVVLDHSNEQIITGDADITFEGDVTMTAGTIGSTSGEVNFAQGGSLSAGNLNLGGTRLVTSTGFSISGVNVTSDENSLIDPIANAGSDQSVASDGIATLSGIVSSDLDGSIVTYNWSQTSGPFVLLSDANVSQPTFTAPHVTGSNQTLIFELTVTDDDGLTGSDNVVVTILAGPEAPTGSLGDIDGNGLVNDADIAQLNVCLTHQQFVHDFNFTATDANSMLNLVFAEDCTRLIDLDGDEKITGSDTLTLAQCIKHHDLVHLSGNSEIEANAALEITYATDCNLVNSQWP